MSKEKVKYKWFEIWKQIVFNKEVKKESNG